MSDHAGDVAHKLRRGYLAHPGNQDDRVTASTEATRDRHVFAVLTGDGGAFRVTVEDVGYEGLTNDELEAPLATDDGRDRSDLEAFGG